MSKKGLSERDICTKYITPAIQKAGWDAMSQIREEVSFNRRIIVRGKLVTRGKAKRVIMSSTTSRAFRSLWLRRKTMTMQSETGCSRLV